jgi:carboxypeptidase Taq
MTPKEAYDWLHSYSKESAYLNAFADLAGWDQATYIPKKGYAHRAHMMAAMAKLGHERSVNPKIGEMLAKIEGSKLAAGKGSVQAANIRGWRRTYNQATKVPERLAVELARASSEGQSVWEQARPKNDWKTFQPVLKRNIGLARELADALGYAGERYDALLDLYEEGATAAQIEPVFAQLRAATVDLLRRIKDSGRRPNTKLLHSDYPKAAQEAFGKEVIARLGFDMQATRLDVVAHPFQSTIGPGDVRITTRYDENFFSTAFFGTVHEMGHGAYEQGLLPQHWGTAAGNYASLGIHESQSRTWENLVARSLGFWRCFYPQAKKHFKSLKGIRLEEFHFAVNAVKPSLIRIEADEVTYNLHIMIRFELELALLRGKLEVKDLPEAWDQKYQEYLGVRAKHIGDGCMQDVHWSGGLIGYFPTYSLGNLYAAQFYRKAEKDLGKLETQFAKGKFLPFMDWTRSNIHQMGARLKAPELVKHVTGEAVNPEYLIGYLNRKFGELYGL